VSNGYGSVELPRRLHTERFRGWLSGDATSPYTRTRVHAEEWQNYLRVRLDQITIANLQIGFPSFPEPNLWTDSQNRSNGSSVIKQRHSRRRSARRKLLQPPCEASVKSPLPISQRIFSLNSSRGIGVVRYLRPLQLRQSLIEVSSPRAMLKGVLADSRVQRHFAC
jgi:hypothetical protein